MLARGYSAVKSSSTSSRISSGFFFIAAPFALSAVIPQPLTATSNFSFMGSNMSRSSASQTALPNEKNGKLDRPEAQWRSILSPKQYAVLRDKGTDPPHRGEYDAHFVPNGVYVCAGCSAPLYTSEFKWDCGCGWPGFWTNVPKMVREEPDKDGRRVEILCNMCNGHLGHVFRGEGFSNPAPNERHCVNSTSIKFVQKPLQEVQQEFNKNSSAQQQ